MKKLLHLVGFLHKQTNKQTNKQTSEQESEQASKKEAASKHASNEVSKRNKQFLTLQAATSLSIKGQGYISICSTSECLRGPDKARVKVPEDVTM